MFRFGTRAVKMISMARQISECISCHHLVRAPITLLDIQSKVAIACQCNSFPAIISRCFCQHFFIFWGTIFGSHFWAPFLVPLTILRENLTGARGSKFKNGPPFLGPKNCIIFVFFRKNAFLHIGKNMYLLAVQTTLLHQHAQKLAWY